MESLTPTAPEPCLTRTWPTVSTVSTVKRRHAPSRIMVCFNGFHFPVQMVTCLFLFRAPPCPSGACHRGEPCPTSLVPTALTASAAGAASRSPPYCKYQKSSSSQFITPRQIVRLRLVIWLLTSAGLIVWRPRSKWEDCVASCNVLCGFRACRWDGWDRSKTQMDANAPLLSPGPAVRLLGVHQSGLSLQRDPGRAGRGS